MREGLSDMRDFLRHVQCRPTMYVRNWSLDELETMCHGYSTALLAHGIEEFGTRFNERFCEFLWRRYEWSMCMGWSRGLRERSASDQGAFDRFFELLEEFKAATA